jgi:hypothetical protein
MLEEQWKEIIEQNLTAKNLKYAILALGYLILAGLAQYIAMDGFGPGANLILIRCLIAMFFILTIVSGVYAFLACKNSLKSLRTNKNTRNYIALFLGGILLLLIAAQIINYL